MGTGSDHLREVRKTNRQVARVELALLRAKLARKQALIEAQEAGYSLRDLADVLKVSRQRVQQYLEQSIKT